MLHTLCGPSSKVIATRFLGSGGVICAEVAVVEVVCVVAELAVVTLGVSPPHEVRNRIAVIYKIKKVLKKFFIFIVFLACRWCDIRTVTVYHSVLLFSSAKI